MKLKSVTAVLLMISAGLLLASCSRTMTPYQAAHGKHGRKCHVLR